MRWPSKKSDTEILVENQNELAAQILTANAMIESLAVHFLADVDDEDAAAFLNAFTDALQPDDDDDAGTSGAQRRERVGELALAMAGRIEERRKKMLRRRR